MSLFDDPLPPSCHLKSPFGEPPPPLHVGDVLCEWPLTVLPYKFFDSIFQSYSFNISGEVMKSGDLKCVFGEGMPTYRNPFEKGKLIIQFTVDFPETLDPAIIPKLEKLLPAK